MDKKYQRILVGVFSLVFFITAPIFISPQVTTFAEHIQLFPAILMQDPISSTLSTENFFPSHRLRYAVEIQKNEIVLKNIQTPIGTSIEQRTIANLAPREIFSDLLWAKSEKKIFLKTSNRAIFFVISRNDQLVDIKKMLNFLPDKCEWHPS